MTEFAATADLHALSCGGLSALRNDAQCTAGEDEIEQVPAADDQP